jgi:hypothetical protein
MTEDKESPRSPSSRDIAGSSNQHSALSNQPRQEIAEGWEEDLVIE